MEEKIKELEKRIAALEKEIQAQPTLKQIVNSVADELKNSLKSIIHQ